MAAPIQVHQITAPHMAATNILTMSSSHGLENECREIHDSWGSLNQLIPSLARRTQLERQQIRETYRTIYCGEEEDLISLLQRYEAGISPMKSTAFSLWMLDSHERDAVIAREALHEEDDTNYKALVEIFVGRKSDHIHLMKQAYQRRFRRQLDQDIINIEAPHPYKKILVALTTSHKAHHADVSQHIAKCDARRLYETGEGGGSGAIEAVVLETLSKRSIQQLKLTLSSYKHIYGHDYTKSLKRGNSGALEQALKMVVKCICSPPNYYAKALYLSIQGRTIDKSSFERVLMSRADVDMDEILRVFRKKYCKELKDAICESIPSGVYRDFLVVLATKTT